MKFLTEIKKKPPVAHLLRAAARYGNRMGPQFAGAITYFSILAIVPVLMVGFAILGLTVTTIRPEMMGQLQDAIKERIGSSGFGEAVTAAVKNALDKWGTVGIVGLGSAIYAGAGWISNLKTAVRAQWRPELEPDEKNRNFFLALLINIATLLGLLLIGGVAVGASTFGTALNERMLHLLGLDAVPGATFLTWLATFAISVVGSTILFLYVYRVFPRQHARRRQWLIGSLVAGVAFALLQTFAGLLLRMFGGNPAASAFGPVIVVMLVFNIFAQITLFIAAWIATTNQPAVARTYNEADEPLRHATDVEVADDHWAAADEDKRQKEAKKLGDAAPENRTDSARQAWARQQERAVTAPVPPAGQTGTMIPEDVAAKGVRAGMGAGYVVGAATGVGLGALAGRVVHHLANRRKR